MGSDRVRIGDRKAFLFPLSSLGSSMATERRKRCQGKPVDPSITHSIILLLPLAGDG